MTDSQLYALALSFANRSKCTSDEYDLAMGVLRLIDEKRGAMRDEAPSDDPTAQRFALLEIE